ncbi:hypothetical protein B4113_2855 [Geobacillus sp. B4113_201601]|nr:hypothetical protein B4113_2855 [Geobacillus sp. B4113_201601]
MIIIKVTRWKRGEDRLNKTIICQQCGQPLRRLKHSWLCQCGMKIVLHR